jgi:hypothetical protein
MFTLHGINLTVVIKRGKGVKKERKKKPHIFMLLFHLFGLLVINMDISTKN